MNQQQIINQLTSPRGILLSRVLAIVLGLLAIWMIYSFWQDNFQITSSSSKLPEAAAPTLKTGLPDISQYNLFGKYIPSQINTQDVPKTNLDLKLVGIMVAVPEQYGQVIIALPGEPEKVYGIGDELPGGAKIYRILPDGVILSRNGAYESLPLVKKPLEFLPISKPLPMEKNQ